MAESLSSEPDWAIVLHYIYRRPEEVTTYDDDVMVDRGHPLESNTKLTWDEVQRHLEFLDLTAGLIDYTIHDEWLFAVSLTQKGFDVAHEREMRRERLRLDQKQGTRQNWLTFGLVLFAGGTLFANLLALVINNNLQITQAASVPLALLITVVVSLISICGLVYVAKVKQ
jgi:hypothetical protein